MRLSQVTPSSPSVSAACRMVSQSDWLPMMMATAVDIGLILSGIQKVRPIIGSDLMTARRGREEGMHYPVLVNPGKSGNASSAKNAHEKAHPGEPSQVTETEQTRSVQASAGARGSESDDPAAARRTGAGAKADRGTAGFRGHRLPARHSQPARLRARARPRAGLYQALSRLRRADRARRRSPQADQRYLRTR